MSADVGLPLMLLCDLHHTKMLCRSIVNNEYTLKALNRSHQVLYLFIKKRLSLTGSRSARFF